MNTKFGPAGLFYSAFLAAQFVFTIDTCSAAPDESSRECMQELFQNGPSSMTLGEAREICNASIRDEGNGSTTGDEEGMVTERLENDEENIRRPFTLMSHRNNYILLGSYNPRGWETSRFEEAYNVNDLDADDVEVQFQLSIKTPLAVGLFGSSLDLFAGYTVNSHWQFYNSDMSSPFRETNHEPEVWLQMQPEHLEILGFTNTVNGIGLNHMSNGQGGSLSRSWNRVFGLFGFEKGDTAFMLKPWFRLKEDPEDDDNPDITDYYGHGEIWLVHRLGEHTLSLMTRNNIESAFSRGAVQLGWSFPLFNYPYLKGYIQYFSGYGESLIDYDRYVNQIGIGLQLTDVL